MSQIITRTIKVTTTGTAGSATGTATIGKAVGYLLDMRCDWHASAPATSVCTVTHNDPSYNLIVTPAGNTDANYAPRQQSHGPNGSTISFYDKYVLDSTLNVTVTLSNALTDCLVLTLRYLKP